MKAFIVANGTFSDHKIFLAVLKPGDLVIAADGGARHCHEMGVSPHVAIGDFDSLSPVELDDLRTGDTQLIRYPSKKDFTDLELAIDYAQQRNPEEIQIYGGLGLRWDQTLANLLLLARTRSGDVFVRMIDGKQEVMLATGPGSLVIAGDPGDTVSLIPIAGDAFGITTDGLEYPLSDEILFFGATRGVSNALTKPTATVSLQRGMLICVLIHCS